MFLVFIIYVRLIKAATVTQRSDKREVPIHFGIFK